MKTSMATQFKSLNCICLLILSPALFFLYIRYHYRRCYIFRLSLLLFFLIISLTGMKTHKAFCPFLSFCPLATYPNNYTRSIADTHSININGSGYMSTSEIICLPQSYFSPALCVYSLHLSDFSS